MSHLSLLSLLLTSIDLICGYSLIQTSVNRPRIRQSYARVTSNTIDALNHRISHGIHASAHDVNDSDDRGDEINIISKTKSSRMERIKKFAQTIMVRPIGTAAPKAIADILTDATYGAVDLAVDEVSKVATLAATAGSRIIRSRAFSRIIEEGATLEGDTNMSLDKIALAKTSIADAFLIAEQTILDAEFAIQRSKQALILVSIPILFLL